MVHDAERASLPTTTWSLTKIEARPSSSVFFGGDDRLGRGLEAEIVPPAKTAIKGAILVYRGTAWWIGDRVAEAVAESGGEGELAEQAVEVAVKPQDGPSVARRGLER